MQETTCVNVFNIKCHWNMLCSVGLIREGPRNEPKGRETGKNLLLFFKDTLASVFVCM